MNTICCYITLIQFHCMSQGLEISGTYKNNICYNLASARSTAGICDRLILGFSNKNSLLQLSFHLMHFEGKSFDYKLIDKHNWTVTF